MPKESRSEGTAPANSGAAAGAALAKPRLLVRSAAAIAVVAMGIGLVLTWRLSTTVPTGLTVRVLPLLALLGAASQGCRFLRWHVLAIRQVPRLRIADSLRIYIAGFALELTPGRLGALLKFSLLRQTTGVPEAETMPIIAVESTAEVASFLITALAGAVLGSYALPQIGAGSVVALALLAGILLMRASGERSWLPLPGVLTARLPLLRSFFAGLRSVGSPGPVLLALSFALAARAWEVLLFRTAADSIGLTLPLPGNILAWGASGLAGGLSLLPGGVGAAEGAIVAAVTAIGGTPQGGLLAALLTRFMTLWLWVPVGLVCALASTRSDSAAPLG